MCEPSNIFLIGIEESLSKDLQTVISKYWAWVLGWGCRKKLQMQRRGKKRRLDQRRRMLPAPGHCLRLCLHRFGSTVTQQGAWGYNGGGAEGERSFFSGSQCHFVLYIMDEHEEAQDLNALESVLHFRISDSVVGNHDQFLWMLQNCTSEGKGTRFMNYILICCLNILHE